MCGFAGIFNFQAQKPVSVDVLTAMRDSLIHRGPDGAGIWLSSDGRVGLGHRRLAIIDLSESANQPMCNEDEKIWIVFNGEIYNHQEIRPELEARGHRFKTDHSDTEVILHAFEEWGIECVERFRGMFAFAIWDDRKKELWICRDRLGIKPIYYTFVNGIFLFASEIKAILEYPGVPREVDPEAMYHYLSFLATPAPHTMFRGIKKLPPASCAVIREDGQMNTRRYWDVWDHTSDLSKRSEEEIAERLQAELRDAVRYRKVSDVPVGIFLSGGIDSSTNAALFSENEASPVKTFTVGYDKNEYVGHRNEFEYARKMADHIGAEHHELTLDATDLVEFLPRVAALQDEPIADPVCFPLYSIAKFAKEHGITVCQVGEGADELFCGYPHWQKLMAYQSWVGRPIAEFPNRLGAYFLKKAGLESKMKFERLRRAALGEPIFWGGEEAFTEAEKKALLGPELQKRFRNFSSYEILKPIRERFMERAMEKTPLSWMSYLDLNLRIPELLMMRVDKMTMMSSLEAREPFLDHKLVELAMSIPEELKVKHGTLKYILKKSVQGLVPPELIDRKKQGFIVPVGDWMSGELGRMTAQKLADFAKRTGFFSPEAVQDALEANDRGRNAWLLLNFVLWHEQWIEQGVHV